MKDWLRHMSIRWKLQLGFFVVTMVTTVYNRMLASHERSATSRKWMKPPARSPSPPTASTSWSECLAYFDQPAEFA